MTRIGREQFRHLSSDLSEAYRWISDRATVTNETPRESIARTYDEWLATQSVMSYADAFDAKDLDRLLDQFAAEGLLTTRRGSWLGQAEIRAFYEPFMTRNWLTYHRIQDIVVRTTEPGEEILLSAYFHAPFIASQNHVDQFGRYFGRLEKHDGKWRLADWTISVDANWLIRPLTD